MEGRHVFAFVFVSTLRDFPNVVWVGCLRALVVGVGLISCGGMSLSNVGWCAFAKHTSLNWIDFLGVLNVSFLEASFDSCSCVSAR